MNKLIIYTVIALFAGVACDKDDISPRQADRFIKNYGGRADEYGSDVKQLPDNGYFIVGTVNVGDNTDVFTLITDEYGNSKTGLKTFGGPYNDKISMIELLPDGSAVATGTYQKSLNNSDIWIMRFDSKGDTLWTQKYGKAYNDEGTALLVNEEDSVIVCTGYTTVLINNVQDKQIWLYARNLDGSILWPRERELGYDKDDEGNYIVEVENGYVVVGTTQSIPSGTTSKNIALLKMDRNGVSGFMKSVGGDDDDYGKMVRVLPDGNLLVLGTTINSTSNSSDIILAKVDASLNAVTQIKALDNGGNEAACCLLFKDNTVHILGTTTDPRSVTKKTLLIITNESGDNPRFLEYSFKNDVFESFGIDYTSDGGFVFTGSNLVLYKIKDPDE
ncbi:MAG: hypothetical protein JW723_00775 [Bacteroidales bacterium]|nr:hypothetical protein [Bacteroidales bacterium]